MVNSRVKENCTSQQGIIIWENLSLIKRKEEASIPGLARKVTSMRESSREEKEMEGAPSGGQMAAGTKEISGMEFSRAGECSIAKEDTENTKVTGIMACSTAKALSISRTGSDTRELSKKTSSTGRESSTKMTL